LKEANFISVQNFVIVVTSAAAAAAAAATFVKSRIFRWRLRRMLWALNRSVTIYRFFQSHGAEVICHRPWLQFFGLVSTIDYIGMLLWEVECHKKIVSGKGHDVW
jgi:hypothetical protein